MSTVVRWATRNGRSGKPPPLRSPGPTNSVIVTPGAWSTPLPRRTMPTVRARMRASRASDAWSTYQTSMASRSSQPVVLRPFTWAHPVMPGPDLQPAGLGVVVPRRYVTGRGRGPTRAMSPRTTWTSVGSSSRLVARSTRPMRVRRAASCCGPSSSDAAGRIVRNLTSSNGRPPRPLRAWRNSTGGPSTIRIATAIAASSGAVTDEQRGRDDDVERPLHHDARSRRAAPAARLRLSAALAHRPLHRSTSARTSERTSSPITRYSRSGPPIGSGMSNAASGRSLSDSVTSPARRRTHSANGTGRPPTTPGPPRGRAQRRHATGGGGVEGEHLLGLLVRHRQDEVGLAEVVDR